MRRVAIVLALAACFAPGGARASAYDYTWALPRWRTTWAAPKLADNRGFAVRTDATSAYVAGVTGSHGQGAGDLFLLRYDLDGNLIWARNWGGFQLDQAQGIALDTNSVWVAGSYTNDAGTVLFALLRFSKDGDVLLAKTWGSGVANYLQGVAIDGNDVYVTGLTKITAANSDVYVAKLAQNGTLVNEITRGGTGFDEGWDIAVDASTVYVSGFVSPTTTEQAFLLRLDRNLAQLSDTQWGSTFTNEEARALALAPGAIYVTGGITQGDTTDILIAKLDRATGAVSWTRSTSGAVVGGGGYGIGVGARGIYVTGGSYDFPAGGDGAIFRFSTSGDLEWHQYYGLPGFWDWGFDVDVAGGSLYVTGVLYQPGAEWYTVTTMRYDENFPTVSLTGVAQEIADGDAQGAQAAINALWPADFIRWAEGIDATHQPTSRIWWEGASNSGRQYGRIDVSQSSSPPVSQDGAVEAFTGLQYDMMAGNYSLVRDWTAVNGSLLDGLIRFRYCISHDRLIPQGGYAYIGDFRIPLPPPPV